MKTRRAWAWLAAGVLALGLNGFYQDGGAAWAHRAMDGLTVRVAERSLTLLSLASEALDRVRDDPRPYRACGFRGAWHGHHSGYIIEKGEPP